MGGNQAEEGMAFILGFANETAKYPDQGQFPTLSYKSVIERENYRVTGSNREAIQVIDDRKDIPESARAMSFALTDFRYYEFLDAFSTLTFGEYKSRYAEDYTRLKKWLDQKITEFKTGKRPDDRLPALKAGDEKLSLIGGILERARTNAIYSNNLDSFSLSNFPETPVRTFTLKQIALRHGKLEPLVAINNRRDKTGKITVSAEVLEKRREATLEHLLTKEQLRNIVDNPHPDNASTLAPETAGSSNTPEPVTPTDTWSRNGDIKADMRMSAQTVTQGETLRIFFREGSVFNENYSYFWKVSGTTNDVIPFGRQSSFEIDTGSW